MVSALSKISISSRVSFQPTVITVVKNQVKWYYWGNWDSIFPDCISKSVEKQITFNWCCGTFLCKQLGSVTWISREIKPEACFCCSDSTINPFVCVHCIILPTRCDTPGWPKSHGHNKISSHDASFKICISECQYSIFSFSWGNFSFLWGS